jgi:hypothetical protein
MIAGVGNNFKNHSIYEENWTLYFLDISIIWLPDQ